LNQGKPLFNLVEEWSQKYREMIILTDWDRKGGRLARLLTEAFDANDMKYDLKYRKKLAFLCKKDIKDVQGLPKFMDNLDVRLASRTRCETWDLKTK
jgi:5S rRNA maturation endonuclease (ribonuclease M5)